MIDINLEEYSKEEFSEWDNIERGVMEPNERTHREKLNEHINEVIDSFPIELMIGEMSEATVIEKELEHLDQDI